MPKQAQSAIKHEAVGDVGPVKPRINGVRAIVKLKVPRVLIGRRSRVNVRLPIKKVRITSDIPWLARPKRSIKVVCGTSACPRLLPPLVMIAEVESKPVADVLESRIGKAWVSYSEKVAAIDASVCGVGVTVGKLGSEEFGVLPTAYIQSHAVGFSRSLTGRDDQVVQL